MTKFCSGTIFLFIFSLLLLQVQVCAQDFDYFEDDDPNKAKKPSIILEIIKALPKKDTITYTEVPRGIILSVAQSELFEENSNRITNNGVLILEYISKLLKEFDNNCTIEAHTEEILKDGNIYKEDWEISIVRANVVARYLTYNLGVETGRIFPIGFGKIMPFKDNVSSEQFYDNRIDFVIFDYTVD